MRGKTDDRGWRDELQALDGELHRLRAIVDAMPVAWGEHEMVYDADGRPIDYLFLDVNAAFERMTGLSRHAVIGKPVSEIFPQIRAAEPDLIAIYGEVTDTGQERRLELHMKSLGRWYTVTAYRHQPGRFIAMFEDTSERHRAEAAVRESESRFRSLVVATAQIVWTTDGHGMASAPQPSWQAYTGQSDKDLEGGGWTRALHPDDAGHVLAIGRRAVASGRGHEVEGRIRRHDGVYRHFAIRGAPIMADDGTVRLWIGACSDITERKEAQQALAENEESLAITLDSIAEAVIATDGDGCVRRMNPAAERLTGRSLADAMARPLGSVVRILREDTREVQELPASRGPLVLCASDGSERLVDAICSPMHTARGEPAGMVLVLRDQTASVLAERSLRAAEARLAERHALLQNLLESSQDEIFSVDREYRYTAFNAQHMRLVADRGGHAVATGRSVLDGVSDPAELDRTRAGLDRALAGEQFREELRSDAGGQGPRFAEVSHNPVRDAAGAVVGASVFARDVTDRKWAELAVVESERRYRSLFENMLDGYALCRLLYRDGEATDFIYLEVNSSFEHLTGLHDVVGKQVSELIPGIRTLNPGVIEIYARVAATGKPERFETHLESLGVWLDVAVYSPAPEHFVAVFNNITDRVESAEAIRRSEERFRTFFDSAPIGKLMTDPDGRLERVNPAMGAMLGYAADELVSVPWAAVTHPDDMAISRDAQEALLSGRRPSARFEKRYLRRDGEVVWADVNVAAVRNARGQVTHFITHVIDITDRKRAEQLHSRADQTLRRLMEGLQGEYFFYGRRGDGSFSYVSPSVENVLGYAPAEVLDHFFDYLSPGDIREECIRRMERGVRGVRQPPFAAEMRHKDGTVHWLEIVELPAMEGELVVGVDGIAHDTTSRRALELEVNHMRKLQAIGQLAAGIAHEINTPVQYVGDSLRFLKEAFDDLVGLMPRYREAVRELGRAGAGQQLIAELGEIEQDVDLDDLLSSIPGAFSRSFDGVGRVSGIVSAMKDFAHMDRRDKCAADLNRALQSTLTISRNEYKYVADMELELGDIPPVVCHLSDLNQVFLNLIVNAAHAIGDVVGSSGDRGTIRIRTRDEGAFVCIDIADSGAGIAPAIRERVFEPFFTTKPIGLGSGQGLAIARSIVVDRHGGTLTFDSEVGKGTTFHIRVPVRSQPAGSDDL